MGDEMTCDEVREVVFEFHRGELSGLRRAEVDQHLDECDECRELVVKLGEMFEAARDVESEDWAEIDPDEMFGRVDTVLQDGAKTTEELDEEARLDEAFEVAGRVESDEWGEIDEDGLFDRIADDVRGDETVVSDRDESGAASGEVHTLDSSRRKEAGDSEPESRSSGPSRGPWIAVAAAACLVVVGWWAWSSDLFSLSVDETSPTADLTGQVDESAGAEGIGLASLQRISSPYDSVQLFAGADADYRFGSTDRDESVELNRGSLLVEFRPEADREFTVGVQSYTVTVTGTVFYVEVRESAPRVAVYEGEIQVEGPDGGARRVETGEFLEGERRGDIDVREREDVGEYVDLEAHRRMLQQLVRDATEQSEQRIGEAVDSADVETEAVAIDRQRVEQRVAAGESEPPAQQPDPIDGETPDETAESPESGESKPEPPSLEDETPEKPDDEPAEEFDSPREFHETALDALYDEEPARAARLLERALDETEPSGRVRADMLLELARIYLRQLDEPDRAAGVLEDFLAEWPEDPAADAIRDQLCELDVEGTDVDCD